jgi:biopolymer transport protein ExbD
MSRIKKKTGKGSPGVSTASLPDIVFILLFFFMAVAVMKTTDPLVEYTKPSGQAIYRFEDASILANIRVGKEIGSKSNAPKIQLNDAIKSLDDIAEFIQQKRGQVDPTVVKDIVAYMDVDVNVKMAIINKIKERLQAIEHYDVAFLALDAQ